MAEGMRFAAELSAYLCGASRDFVTAQGELLDNLGLPALAWSAEPAALLAAMKRDKKARGGNVRFVLVRDVGDWTVEPVDDDVVLAALEAWAAARQ